MPPIFRLKNNSVTTIELTENSNNHKQSEPKAEVNMSSCLNDIPFKIARPLAVSMSIFGLLHLSGTERRWAPIRKIYSTVILLLLWAMVIRMFTLYGSEGFGPVLIFKIVLHSWTVLCASAATSTYMACWKQNKLVEFLTRWSKLLKTNRGCDEAFVDFATKQYSRKAKLSVYSCLILSWLSFLVACGAFGYANFATSFVDFLLTPMEPNHPHAFLLKCMLYVFFVFTFASWVFTLCLFYNICSVVREEFRIFHVEFENAVHPNGDIVGVENYRRRHQEICLLVENADDILSGFSAVSIVMNMLQGMLVLYNMLWYSDFYDDLVFLLCNIFLLLSVFVHLGIIVVSGGHLNHVAHTPLKTIHNIQLKTISTEISLQISMFLIKLTGESIGLTAMGMFVIDKPTILTIAGAFLTYFVVLAQFKQPSGANEFVANCTSFIGQ